MLMAYTHITTPLGRMLIAAHDHGLAGAWFEGQQHHPDMSGWHSVATHAVLKNAEVQLVQYMQGQRRAFELPLSPAWGTPFQREVWQALQAISFGSTTSYGELAHHLNKPQAARAVGAAVGRNPWSVIVPCHRVVGARGALTGYAGGLARKVALLQLEGVLL
jgi:methylated-DNA-[protein]-cysteine S-methyltransferase